MIVVNGLGDMTADITAIMSQTPAVLAKAVVILKKVVPHVEVISYIVNDPSFPSLMDRIKTLHAIEVEKARAKPAAPQTFMSKSKAGVGLKPFVSALDGLIYIRRNPVVPWLAGGGLLLFIGGIGYLLGRRRSR